MRHLRPFLWAFLALLEKKIIPIFIVNISMPALLLLGVVGRIKETFFMKYIVNKVVLTM